MIIIVTVIFIKNFSNQSEKVLMDYVSFNSTNIISSMINESINEIIYKNSFDNIINDYRDNNGNITKIDFDNLAVNRILYLITDELLKNDLIKSTGRIYYVPLGIIYDTPVLNNLGPKIPYKIEMIKSINNTTKTNVKEYGINSSLIELVLNIELKIKVIMPFKSKTVDIKKNIILDSKIVQGKVPDYYGGLLSGSLK